jgi:hypothetical protein
LRQIKLLRRKKSTIEACFELELSHACICRPSVIG